ncbi:hypothetical protein ACERK3_07175 [Phycisphaerales bacterium AB-hyl4]|uniref:Uncharacterized protein n=1 Tax=Natronomicrosphaera hydrolytica TaxID=3242702 RepID=A0ABV4U5F0_9BACT
MGCAQGGPDGDEQTESRNITLQKTSYGWRFRQGSSAFAWIEIHEQPSRSCDSYEDEWWKVEVGVNTNEESASCTAGNVNYDCCQHSYDYWDGQWWLMETNRSKLQVSITTSDCDVQEGI